MDNSTNFSVSQISQPPKLSPIQKFFYGTGCAYELTKWLIIGLVVLTLVHFYVGTILIVEGASMEPNFYTGEYILINRSQYLFDEPRRGEAVVLKFPGDPEHTKYIKRIIGLPGERVDIKNGVVFINSQELNEPYLPPNTVTLPNLSRNLESDDYFLLGDNRIDSSDSRIWGVCPRKNLIGKAIYILWPLTQAGKIEDYSHSTVGS